MKKARLITVIITVLVVLSVVGCATRPKVIVVELENKGTAMKVRTPEWVTTYVGKNGNSGITELQRRSEFRDKYCIVGETSGANREFVLTWADNFNAQQRLGFMVQTAIDSIYKGREQGTDPDRYQREFDNILTSAVNVRYSGAQREADWWSLLRRYDPDEKNIYNDQYTAYVLYTIPKSLLNDQVARFLETVEPRGSELYDYLIDMAQQIRLHGFSNWGL